MDVMFDQAREALAFLERHQLDPSTANYNFALHYVTTPASELAREVDVLLYDGVRLTPSAVNGLMERHLLPSVSAAVDHRKRTVERQAEQLGTLTTEAHDLTEALGRDVGSMAQQTDDWPQGANDLSVRLSEAERELASLRNEFQKLRDEIGVSTARPAPPERDETTQSVTQHDALRVIEPMVAQSRTFVLMMFSVDDLSRINDRFGRSVGDNVLNAFAATLRQTFPDCDPIRWTSNEFVVVATDTVVTGARLLAEEALVALAARRLKLRGSGEWIGTITASAGIAVGGDDSIHTTIDRARAGKAAAAAQGGNRVEG